MENDSGGKGLRHAALPFALKAISFAILAATLYAVNVPLSKLLLRTCQPVMMASLLYLGAGFGLLAMTATGRMFGIRTIKTPLTRHELPYTIAMVLLDIIAPILLMHGIERTTSANVSLLNNFEIVATSLIAFMIFHEKLSKTFWGSLLLIALASVMLGWEGNEGLTFNTGSLLVLGASLCWGFENNCTRKLSSKSSVEIVTVKGCCSGLGSLIIALLSGESFPQARTLILALVLGFFSYGLSINFYILAQKGLGAAKTSAYYSVAPFLGVLFSMLLLGERPNSLFYLSLAIMAIATILISFDTLRQSDDGR